MIESLLHDTRYALRGLRARPGFAAMVVVTFALGIGANAAMFGVIDRLLLRAPAHVRDPERLVEVHARWLGDTYLQSVHSYAVYKDLRDHVPDFQSVAAATPNMGQRQFFPLGRGPSASRVAGALVTGSYFTTLGVTPALGRFFAPGEDDEHHAQRVAVIGHGFWRRHFGARADAIGRTLELGADKYTVVGVAPEGFTGLELSEVDVWLPIAAAEGLRFDRTPDWSDNRSAQWLLVVARLRPGVRPEHALAQATAAFRAGEVVRIAQAASRGQTLRMSPDSEVVELGSVIPGRARGGFGITAGSAEARVARLLGGVSLVVLLIACANVANLLVVRALGRRREIAVRLALGVSRRRLVAQLLIEGLLLSGAGGAAAVAVAAWGAGFVRALLLGDSAWAGGVVNARVLGFTLATALVTGVATAILPALQSTRLELTGALKAGAREGAAGGAAESRTRAVLLAAQAALAVLLLAGAGLFVRSLRNVAALPIGIDVDHLVIGHITHGSVGLTNEQARALYDRFAERVRALPGVTASAVSVGLPFGLSWSARVSVPGRTLPEALRQGERRPVQYAVTPDYFAALGVRLLAGRSLTAADRLGTVPVAVVNESFARLIFPNESPLGQCVKVGADTMPCTTVVGVVTNTRRQELVEGLVPQLYRPLDQLPAAATNSTVTFFGYTLVAHTAGDAARYVEPIRRAMQGTSALVPYADVRTMSESLGRRTRSWTLGARMFGLFGTLALVLAVVGLYSVVAFSVAQRTHELGVRVALGAQRGDVVRLTVARGIAPAAAGVLAGLVLALAAGRLVGALLFDVSPRDPLALGAAATALLLAGLAASLVPAVKASRVDPMIALRTE